MGSDAAGNRYYENRVDFPFGQHRWVEPGDIHNFDAASVPPEWQGWMISQNDAPPVSEDDYIEETLKNVPPLETVSHAPDNHHLGHQEKLFHFHHMHNQSQVRSRGYGIGNHVVGLPPHVKDSYYTQPGSPYNDAFLRDQTPIGSLDADGGRPYKNQKWAARLRTADENKQLAEKELQQQAQATAELSNKRLTRKQMAMIERGGAAAIAK